MFKYSEKLIQETIKVFRDENDLELTKEEAREFIDNLVNLYLAFVKK
jgi:hypothetical protein